ncbi:MAG TPA: divergent polysaccharide deacetylase family protein [Syntrophobacteraceae bacterium]|nr:divergent polysaccharide deacetylase family protein [Syntrophobacteraceae bacterium]
MAAKPQLPPAAASRPLEKAPPPPQPVVPPLPLARAAIVIDDLGQDLQIAKRFLAVPLPLTYSILPYQQHSREIAHLARYHQREVLLHLPMEPKGYPKTRPGPGALLVSMSESAVRQTLRKALDETPFAAGVNNHMGSRFTERAELMGVLFAELRQRHLYFLDSYTTEKSVCIALASQYGVPFLRRRVFLDHENSEAFVRAQILALIRKARVEGSAVAIGHPREATLKALLDMAGRFQEEGVLVVPSGELLPRGPSRQSPTGKEDPNPEDLQRGSSAGAS